MGDHTSPMSDKSLSGNLSSQCRFQTIKDQTLTEVCECIILCLVVQTLLEKEKTFSVLNSCWGVNGVFGSLSLFNELDNWILRYPEGKFPDFNEENLKLAPDIKLCALLGAACLCRVYQTCFLCDSIIPNNDCLLGLDCFLAFCLFQLWASNQNQLWEVFLFFSRKFILASCFKLPKWAPS